MPEKKNATRKSAPPVPKPSELEARTTKEPYVVGRSRLAELLGVALTTVDGWRRRGVPRIEDETGRRYVVSDVIQWLCERDVQEAMRASCKNSACEIDLDEIALRRARADTELAELALKESRDRLVPHDIVVQVVDESLDRVRSKISEMPARHAGQFARIQTVGEIKAAIQDAVFEILDELTDFDHDSSDEACGSR